MCGIAGFIYADRTRPVEAETLVAMAAIQHHRGPDGFGWQARDGVGFSHARLSIIDLDQQRARHLHAEAGEVPVRHPLDHLAQAAGDAHAGGELGVALDTLLA